jgi:hypothetical protein
VKLLLFAIVLLSLFARGSWADPAERCAQVGDDDTILLYDGSLRTGLLRAYTHLFPQARTPPDEQQFQAAVHIRCVGGRLLACFTGANLPCSRMNTERENQGAAAYCRSNPDAPFVPAFATGHDSVHNYRCVAGRASIVGETFKLDSRGFAATLWVLIE